MSLNHSSRWEILTSLMSDGFFVAQSGKFVYTNYALEKLLGANPGKLIGSYIADVVHPEMREQVVTNYNNRLEGKPAPRHYEMTVQRLDNKENIDIWLEIDVIREEDSIIAVAGTVRNIGQFRDLKQELSETRTQLNSILDNMSDTIYQTNVEGNVSLISGNVEALLGYTEEEMMGTRLADYYWSPEEREKIVRAIVENDGVVTNVEAILKRKNGTPVWISTNAYVKKDKNGNTVSIEGVARDVTRQKELEQKLEKLALTDSLTSLPNRRALMDDLHAQFTYATENETELSLVYFDVNNFKLVNDQFGHLMGDNLLRHLSITLGAHVSGINVLGRLSGDEFLFILPKYKTEDTILFIDQVLLDLKKNPMQIGQDVIPVTIAVGISNLKEYDKNEYSLLDRADKAMYLAKKGVMNYEVM